MKELNSKIKKIAAAMAALMIMGSVFTGCGADGSEISVLSREEGSGTRGAFVELFGIEQKDADGNKVDHTIVSAEVTNSTSVMMKTVEGNAQAIGYISLGSLNDTVKALKIDGVEATVDNVKNGSYKVSRPFNILTTAGTANEGAADKEKAALEQDFIKYVLSKQGQAVVEQAGYVSNANNGGYTASKLSGKLTIGGSSSVTPVMEALAETYQKINPDVTIEVQQSDSTTGITSTMEGVYDIGMASRELSEEEKAQGIESTVIALDGIAVIVNNQLSVEEMTSDQVLKIYTGEITKWTELGQVNE